MPLLPSEPPTAHSDCRNRRHHRLFVTFKELQYRTVCLSLGIGETTYQPIITVGGPSRWQRPKTWRSSSSPQIHQKYIYMWNNSTEHLLNAGRRLQTSQKTCGWQGLGALAWCPSEVGELSSGCWTTRDLPATRNINRRGLSQRSPSQH